MAQQMLKTIFSCRQAKQVAVQSNDLHKTAEDKEVEILRFVDECFQESRKLCCSESGRNPAFFLVQRLALLLKACTLLLSTLGDHRHGVPGVGRVQEKNQGHQGEFQEESSSILLLDNRQSAGTPTGANPIPCSGGGRLPPTKCALSLITLALVVAHPLLLASLVALPRVINLSTFSLPSQSYSLHCLLRCCTRSRVPAFAYVSSFSLSLP